MLVSKEFLNELKNKDFIHKMDPTNPNREFLIYHHGYEKFVFLLDSTEKEKVKIDYYFPKKHLSLSFRQYISSFLYSLEDFIYQSKPKVFIDFSDKILNDFLIFLEDVDKILTIKKLLMIIGPKSDKKIKAIKADSYVAELLEESEVAFCEKVGPSTYEIKTELNEIETDFFEQLTNNSFSIQIIYQEEEKEVFYHYDDLINLSLDTKDKKWFFELIEKQKKQV